MRENKDQNNFEYGHFLYSDVLLSIDNVDTWQTKEQMLSFN